MRQRRGVSPEARKETQDRIPGRPPSPADHGAGKRGPSFPRPQATGRELGGGPSPRHPGRITQAPGGRLLPFPRPGPRLRPTRATSGPPRLPGETDSGGVGLAQQLFCHLPEPPVTSPFETHEPWTRLWGRRTPGTSRANRLPSPWPGRGQSANGGPHTTC